MIESDHTEERLARVEYMLARCRREAAALEAIAASKIVVTCHPRVTAVWKNTKDVLGFLNHLQKSLAKRAGDHV